MFEYFFFQKWMKYCLDSIDKKNTCSSCCSCKLQIESTFTLKATLMLLWAETKFIDKLRWEEYRVTFKHDN